jgi:hypothetical protein
VVCHQKKAATCSERLTPPPLPGGYKVGEKVFFTGASQTASSGNKLVHGQQGEVKRPATFESVKGKGVCVPLLFPGNKGSVDFFLTSVTCLPSTPRRLPPPPAPHTRDAANAPSVPTTASVPRRPSPHSRRLHAQPLAPQPTARMWDGTVQGRWPRA